MLSDEQRAAKRAQYHRMRNDPDRNAAYLQHRREYIKKFRQRKKIADPDWYSDYILKLRGYKEKRLPEDKAMRARQARLAHTFGFPRLYVRILGSWGQHKGTEIEALTNTHR